MEKTSTQKNGTLEIDELFGFRAFDFPKPSDLIRELVIQGIDDEEEDSIVLDFFSGSCPTPHAVLNINKDNGGNCKFICVQIPEKCDEKSEAYKVGYKTIADIGKERIRRVIHKIKEDKQSKLDLEGSGGDQDLGFKVFKLQESNFKFWRSDVKTEEELTEQLELHTDPVAEDSKNENILYELLLKSGTLLTAQIETKDGYYLVNDGEMVVILDKIDEGIIKNAISESPQKVITLDRLFKKRDPLKTNTALQMKDAEIDFRVV